MVKFSIYLNRRVFVMTESDMFDFKRSTFLRNYFHMNLDYTSFTGYLSQTLLWCFTCKQNVENTVELQWLKHHWDHENLFETWVVRATEG